MQPWSNNPAFVAYAIASLVLTVNLLALWGYSGAVRGKSKSAINEEDAKAFKVDLAKEEPREVARVLRAHANAQASIYPFLTLGLVFVLAGGSATMAWVYFTTFCFARLTHSFVYLAKKQPYRTLAFVVGLLTTVVLAGNVVLLLV